MKLSQRDAGIGCALHLARWWKSQGNPGSVKVWVGIARKLGRSLRKLEEKVWRKAL